MRKSAAALEDYVAEAQELVERYGGVLEGDASPFIKASPSGARSFELQALLPSGGATPESRVRVLEVWGPAGADAFDRVDYGYELVDRERDYRRAFHLHDADQFVRRYQVVVHEHCERPIGTTTCDHYAGHPIRDAFAAVELLFGTWIDPDPPDCDALACLEREKPPVSHG